MSSSLLYHLTLPTFTILPLLPLQPYKTTIFSTLLYYLHPTHTHTHTHSHLHQRLHQKKRNPNNKMKDSTTSNNSNSPTSPTIPSLGERRRSSASSGGGLFANLQSQKRDSTSPDMATRRASWNEQAAKGGPFSKWWDGYMRGNK
jgi:hypothetical protein